MMKKIVLVLYLMSLVFSAQALVPVEGILMGEADTEIQQDPLNFIFKDYFDQSISAQNKKLKLYHRVFFSGEALKNSCSSFSDAKYATPWHEKQARRSVVSTFQYLGLDATIKAMGQYAIKAGINEDEFRKFSKNLVGNYCSKNVTVFSLRTIEKALHHYYLNGSPEIIPSVMGSPFVTQAYINSTETKRARSRELDQLIKNFRAFCSWGGDVADYRMLSPYLKNPFIMSFVFKNLTGIMDVYDEQAGWVSTMPDPNAVQVTCSELICRKSTPVEFRQKFPQSVGSTGISTDLAKLYCGHFRYQEYSNTTSLPEARAWIKAQDLEDPILETSFFISLITGVPDAVMGASSYPDLVTIAKSSIDERWTNFSKKVLSSFSHDMLYEESLRVRPVPLRDKYVLRTEGLKVDFSITLGEMDRIFDSSDKIDLRFELKLSKNYLSWVRKRWHQHSGQLDQDGITNLRRDVTKYIQVQIKEKEKFFRQKIWNESFSELIADEIIAQANLYSGPLFNDYEEKVLTVPVRFTYGVFALSYLKYRADVNAGRLKLNL